MRACWRARPRRIERQQRRAARPRASPEQRDERAKGLLAETPPARRARSVFAGRRHRCAGCVAHAGGSHACAHARTHAHTHARTHAHTHAHTYGTHTLAHSTRFRAGSDRPTHNAHVDGGAGQHRGCVKVAAAQWLWQLRHRAPHKHLGALAHGIRHVARHLVRGSSAGTHACALRWCACSRAGCCVEWWLASVSSTTGSSCNTAGMHCTHAHTRMRTHTRMRSVPCRRLRV
jgi:hypothetical protein